MSNAPRAKSVRLANWVPPAKASNSAMMALKLSHCDELIRRGPSPAARFVRSHRWPTKYQDRYRRLFKKPLPELYARMAKIDWYELDYSTTWSEEDQEWVGLCRQQSGLSWLAPTKEEALAGIVKVTQEALLLLDLVEVKVVMASRLGDLGVTTDFRSNVGYETRVSYERLTDFSATRLTPAA